MPFAGLADPKLDARCVACVSLSRSNSDFGFVPSMSGVRGW